MNFKRILSIILISIMFTIASFSALAQTHIPGDINGDGMVNNKDLGVLRRYLNDWDVEIDEYAADVNGDENVNNKDLGLLRRYLNDWDVVLSGGTTGECNHVEVIDEAVAPTCTKTGLTEGKHCSVCNEVLVEQTLIKTIPHNFYEDVCLVCGKEGKTIYSYWNGNVATTFCKGAGTQDNPYRIQSAEELALLAQMCNDGNAEYSDKYYRLEINIDLQYLSWTPIGRKYQESSSKPVDTKYSFCGYFDGNGHIIKGLSNALFGYINSASIQNLGVVDANIQKRMTSVFVEAVVDSNISNCFSEGKIKAYTTASGYSASATGFFNSASGCSKISNCYADVEVSAYSSSGIATAGGFGGDIGKGSTISKCYSIGDISCISLNSTAYAGGLIGGWNSGGVIDCFTSGNIYIEGARREYGELCGYVYYTGYATNSYSNCIIDALDNGNRPTICNAGKSDFDGSLPNFYYNTLGFSQNWDLNRLTYGEGFYPKLIEFYTHDEYNKMLHETNGCIYLLSDDKNSYYVANYFGKDEKVCIPVTYNGLPINRIAENAFSSNLSISTVQIGDGVETIETNAFKNCTNLETIVLPNPNIEIENGAFLLCPVSNVVYSGDDSGRYFVDGVLYNESIEKVLYVFDTATEVVIPNTVVDLGNKFTNNKNIVSVIFEGGSKLTAFDKESFDNCSSLRTIEIPECVTNIGQYAFKYCENLENIYFNAACASVLIDGGSAGFVFYGAGKAGNGISVTFGNNVQHVPQYLFASYYGYDTPKVVSVNFEEESSCKTIGNSAFEGCKYLVEVQLPNSLNKIHAWAFRNCPQLTNVYFQDTINWIVSETYSSATGTEVVVVDPTTFALYLRETYANHYWVKN